MVARSVVSNNEYRFGYGQQENDTDIGEGIYTAAYWEYDSRLGRRWNIDPITYEWQSSYAVFNNNPIYFNDPLGLEGEPTKDHKVKSNETLGGLAKMYNVTETAIKKANPGIDWVKDRDNGNLIKVDEILKIPTAESKNSLPASPSQSTLKSYFKTRSFEPTESLPIEEAETTDPGKMKPASSYDYNQTSIDGKLTDDYNYVIHGSTGNPFYRAGEIFGRDWGQASTSEKVDVILSAAPILRIGKFIVNAKNFHKVTKPAILKAAGAFEKIVGKNPDIFIENGKIILRGAKSGPYAGKSFETGLDALKFF